MRVLILYADPETLNELQWQCETLGLDTTVTWDTNEMFGLLNEGGYDLVVVGEHAPEVCSAQVLRRLRSFGEAAPCVVFCNSAHYPFETEFLKALGALEVVERSHIPELAQCIANCARRVHRDGKAAAAL